MLIQSELTDVCKIEYKCADIVKIFGQLKIVLCYCSINNFQILGIYKITLLSLRIDFLVVSWYIDVFFSIIYVFFKFFQLKSKKSLYVTL